MNNSWPTGYRLDPDAVEAIRYLYAYTGSQSQYGRMDDDAVLADDTTTGWSRVVQHRERERALADWDAWWPGRSKPVPVRTPDGRVIPCDGDVAADYGEPMWQH